MNAPPAIVRWLLLASLPLAACTGFREGAPGLYRSPQPREEQLVQRIQDHGLRTVVTLRGGDPARLAARATSATDADWVQISMSAKRPPPPATLLSLWQVAATAERPLMVHCKAGVDRTGLAMALFVLHDTGDLGKARDQLAFVPYGHIRDFGTEEMDRVLDLYEPYLERMPFPQWVREVYTAEFAARQQR